MKRILLISCVALLVSCKDEKNAAHLTAPAGRTSVKTMLDKTAFATVAVMKPETEADIAAWLEMDADGSDGSQTNGDLKYSITEKFIFVNLDKFSGDDNNQKKSRWLKSFEKDIDLAVTQTYIEESHRLSHPEAVPEMYDKKEGDYRLVFKVGDLIASIGKEEYDDDRYHRYVEFKPDTPVPTITVHTEYKINSFRFSVQMLKAIIGKNKLGNDAKLAIGTVRETENNEKFTYLWVVGTTHFYDYSNEPR